MIGTKLVLGFDGNAVKKGMAGIGGMMGRLGRQIAIGGARQVGAQMTDWVGKLVMAIPEAVSETMDWAGSLVDLSRQTAMTTKDLMELSEAFRLAGGEGMDAGRMIGTMRKNLYESSREQEGDVVDALRALGLRGTGLESLGPMEQFQKIMTALNSTMGSMDPGQLEKITTALFGGKMGLKGIAVFKDFAAGIKQAQGNLNGLQNTSKESLEAVDNLGDSLGRFSTIKKGLMLEFLKGLTGSGDLQSMDQFVNKIFNSTKGLGDAMRSLGEFFREIMDKFMTRIDTEGGFGGALNAILRDLGKTIGEGIREGVGGLKGMLFPGIPGDGKTSMNNAPLLHEAETTNELLSRIYREKGGMWA
jgi:hypothetical protein